MSSGVSRAAAALLVIGLVAACGDSSINGTARRSGSSTVGSTQSELPASVIDSLNPTAANPLPDGELRAYGAGPQGSDNGVRKTCTGKGPGPQVLCVKSGSSGTGTADSPFGTITDAVSTAKTGDVIQVATGDYAESVRIGNYGPGDCDNAGITGKSVEILGGFSGDFASRDAHANRSTVIGNNQAPSFVVCTAGGRTVIDGFFVTTHGQNRGIIAASGDYAGTASSTTVSHNVVYDNQPATPIDDSTYGGGLLISAYKGGSAAAADNYVHNNTSGRGAGIVATGRDGGTTKILHNRVELNVSRGSHGGGMNIVGNSEIAFNVVIANRLLGELGGGGWGGGFIVDGGSAKPKVHAHHNVVTGNSALSYASGEFYDEDVDGEVEFEFVAMNGCADDSRTAEILVDIGDARDSVVTFRNITVLGHTCPTMSVGALVVQQGAVAHIESSIFSNNVGAGGQPFDFGVDDSGTLTVESTTSRQGHSGSGNETNDPAFTDPANGDYSSTAFSDRGAFASGGLSADQ